jgi:phosphate transport system ATP-binding protein
MREIDLRRGSTDVQIGVPVPRRSGRRLTTGNCPATGGEILASGVAAWFGPTQVLDDVHLEIPRGSVVSIIGPPGSGKSTLLRVLNRMHELTPGAARDGVVRLDGYDIYAPGVRPAAVRRRIGMVFPEPNPFPAMSVRDNVACGLRLAGVTCADRAEVVQASLVRAGLWREIKDRLDAPAGALSAGVQQRLCIARALAVGPRALLMDEPCSTLDPSSTKRIEETVRELSASVTVVIATRNLAQAARVSDFTAFLLADRDEPGGIVDFGPTAALFDTPADSRTEDYIRGRFG